MLSFIKNKLNENNRNKNKCTTKTIIGDKISTIYSSIKYNIISKHHVQYWKNNSAPYYTNDVLIIS